MKIYAIVDYSFYGITYENFFTTRKKAYEYLKEQYKRIKEQFKGDIIKKCDLDEEITYRYKITKDGFVIRYWEKVSYEYNEWDISCIQKEIREIEAEE